MPGYGHVDFSRGLNDSVVSDLRKLIVNLDEVIAGLFLFADNFVGFFSSANFREAGIWTAESWPGRINRGPQNLSALPFFPPFEMSRLAAHISHRRHPVGNVKQEIIVVSK